jgi:Acetyltransferase (GNAT) domain
MKRESHSPPPGWITAAPLEHYSSLNELSLFPLLGLPFPWPQKHFFVQFSFNLHTPLQIDPKACIIFHARDADLQPARPDVCFSMNFNRWRLDISPFQNWEDYFSSLKRWHKCNYKKSKEKFETYGCTVTFEEDDWSKYAEEAYRLYGNVAGRHGDWLYDRHFFKEIAKRPDYKLICAWFQGEMIGVFILQEEDTTLHSIACGLDYHHSTASYAYSWLHYALIEAVIGKYQTIDIGLTADESKQMIGFSPVPSVIDIYASGFVTKHLLSGISRFVAAAITPESKVKFHWRTWSSS